MDRLESLSNGCEVFENEEYLETVSVKQEPTTEEEIPVDIPLDCLLCAKKLHTISGLKAHVIAQHNYKSVKRKCGDCPSPDKSATKRSKHVCTTCGRSFVTSTDLKVHEVCHNKFCCFACNSKFNTFKEVSQHRRRCKKKNEPVSKPKTLTDILNERKAIKQSEKSGENTKQERVKCLECTDSFRDVVSYKIHKILQHGEKHSLENVNQKIEIEIDNVKQEPKENDQKDAKGCENAQVVKDDKGEVDYAKIETELESIFDIAVEKSQMHITILENETDNGSGSADKGVERDDDQEKTIEDILKSPSLSQELKIEPAINKNSSQEQTNKRQVDTTKKSKEGLHTDSIQTEISVNNEEGISNLSKEDLSKATKKRNEDGTFGRNSEKDSNKENAKGPVDTADITVDVNNSSQNLNRKSESSHTKEIQSAIIDNTNTIEEQDKENEKPGQNSDTEMMNEINDVNIKIVTIESAIGKTTNSAIKNTDFNEKEDKCDEIEHQEVPLKGAKNSGPVGESIEK